MAWIVEITHEANSELQKLGSDVAKRILGFLFERVQNCDNPRSHGKKLKGVLREFWRYRVGDYRILCRIDDKIVTVFVIHVGHRREVYRDNA